MSSPSKPLFQDRGRPMQVTVFSSHGPGNFEAAIDVARHNPGLMRVCLLVTDRTGIPSISVATRNRIPVISRDFPNRLSGLKDDERPAATDRLHAEILDEIQVFEERAGNIDMCVLAYRRIIRGPLFEHFRDRMINQHPADLGVFDPLTRRRRYIGIDGLRRSILDGASHTRTCTILVNEEIDAGEILVQGPRLAVPRTGPLCDVGAHEQAQKHTSDWPALKSALCLIAEGALSVGPGFWPDRCRRIHLSGRPLPYCGLQLE